MQDCSPWEEVRTAFLAWSDGGVEYSCEYCAIKFQTATVLFQHVSHVHRVNPSKYASDNPHFAVLREAQWCNLCGEQTHKMAQHLDDAHQKMAPEVYFMRYVFCDQRELPWLEGLNTPYSEFEGNGSDVNTVAESSEFEGNGSDINAGEESSEFES